MQIKSIIIALIIMSLSDMAYAIDLPTFEAPDCKGDQKCIEEIRNGPYLIMALAWNKFADSDKKLCLNNEEYARDHAGFYYKDLLDCLTVKFLQRPPQ